LVWRGVPVGNVLTGLDGCSSVGLVCEAGGDEAVASEEFFEPHEDAYAAKLLVMHGNRNDVVALTG
jgi:hypothetical protein